MKTLRFNEDGSICIVDDNGKFTVALQKDFDTLPVGPDLTPDEIESLDG